MLYLREFVHDRRHFHQQSAMLFTLLTQVSIDSGFQLNEYSPKWYQIIQISATIDARYIHSKYH